MFCQRRGYVEVLTVQLPALGTSTNEGPGWIECGQAHVHSILTASADDLNSTIAASEIQYQQVRCGLRCGQTQTAWQ